MWWANLGVWRKGLVVVALPAAALLLGALVVWGVERRAQQVQDDVERSFEIRALVVEISEDVRAVESRVRGWLLHGEPTLLDGVDNATQRLDRRVRQIQDALAGQGGPDELMLELAELVERRVEGLQAQVGLRTPGMTNAPVVPAAMLEEALDTADRVADVLDELSTREQVRLNDRRAQADQLGTEQLLFGALVLVIGLFGGLVAMRLFTATIAGRLRRLVTVAEALPDRSREVEVDPAGDELGQLSRALAGAAALLRAQEEEVRREAERLGAIVETQRELILAPPERNAVFTAAAAHALRTTGADSAVIELIDADELVYEVAAGTAREHVGMRLRLDTSLSGLAVRTGSVLHCDDTTEDPRVDAAACARVGIASMVVAPLSEDGRPFGVLKVSSAAPAAFSDADVHAVQLLAILTAAVVSRHEAYHTAASANRAKTDFLSRMSHELRTPLNSIIGFAQLLEIEPSLSDDDRDSAKHILKAGRHLLELINEVLDISRIESGRMTLSIEPVLLSDAVLGAIDLVRPLAATAGVQLSAPAAEDCEAYVAADRQRLQQVLLNLLANAVKYNRPGGRVTVDCHPAGHDSWQLRIVDTGVGIAADRLDRVFVPFDRLGAEATDVEGTGLGLALSQRLVHVMGGSLEVRSTEGEGTAVTVELRRSGPPGETTPPPATRHRPADRMTGSVVLYIEDNLSNLRLMERVVGHHDGVRLLTAMQGRLGLDLAQEHQPDLVLLDLNLPDMPGEEVLQRLRGDPSTARIPVVILTADASPGQAARLTAAGAAEYATKPIDIPALRTLLDRYTTTTEH